MDKYYVESLDNFPNDIPLGTSALYFNYKTLRGKSVAEIAQAFALIPVSVTQLDLSNNYLGNKSGKELTQIFSAIPATVIHLVLNGNDLKNISEAWLAQALAAIPISVTCLDLSSNRIGTKYGEDLIQIFASIPTSVSQLDLSWNYLGNKRVDKLAQAFAAISNSVAHLNLSNNSLGNKNADELVQILTALPITVTFINLGNNDIFFEKTFEERDALINRLQAINTHGRLGLENNGEKTFIRAASLLIGMKRNGIFNQRYIPLEIINEIAYWLGAPTKHFFTENSLRKLTQRMQTIKNFYLEETQDSKMSESRFSFLAPPKLSPSEQLAPTAATIELPEKERPKRAREFIEPAVAAELESPQETKRPTLK